MNLDSLIKTIHTKQDQTALLSGLDRLSHGLFDVNDAVPQKIDRYFEEPFRSGMHSFMKDNKLPNEPSQLQKAFMLIKTEILKLPVVVLEVAVEPTPQMISSVNAWFNLSFKQKFITDIRVNRDIIGAMCITVNGLYKDYSVRKRLEGLNIVDMLPN